mmetsp:Transcript_58194/g.189659  ORF Transcript_58194/g.189659 Transcript_58194/m.189659 type:complete len:286 (-) Transcript_58194:2378-3235(-)
MKHMTSKANSALDSCSRYSCTASVSAADRDGKTLRERIDFVVCPTASTMPRNESHNPESSMPVMDSNRPRCACLFTPIFAFSNSCSNFQEVLETSGASLASKTLTRSCTTPDFTNSSCTAGSSMVSSESAALRSMAKSSLWMRRRVPRSSCRWSRVFCTRRLRRSPTAMRPRRKSTPSGKLPRADTDCRAFAYWASSGSVSPSMRFKVCPNRFSSASSLWTIRGSSLSLRSISFHLTCNAMAASSRMATAAPLIDALGGPAPGSARFPSIRMREAELSPRAAATR